MRTLVLFLSILLILTTTASFDQPIQAEINTIGSLKFISEYEVPYNKSFKGTIIGGLSGIDYDPANNEYYFICDDRSAINPARFYKAKIHLTDKGIDSVQFLDVNYLHQPNGTPYPNIKQDPHHTADPEAIRYHAKLKQLVWTSEGERAFRTKDTILTNPSINLIQTNGNYVSEFSIPSNLNMQKKEVGPRRNGTLEGLTFGEDFKKMFVSVEEPLYEDGERVDVNENKVPIRIVEFDFTTKKNTAQYAYIPDPVAYPAVPTTEFKINGVPDILYIGKNKLLILERSFSTGRIACTVKVYLADLNKADNVISVKSLQSNPPLHPVAKKLLLNMDDLGRYIDNVEGITLGPTLPNGHLTLILMSDNNFESFEKTQFFLFEVMP